MALDFKFWDNYSVAVAGAVDFVVMAEEVGGGGEDGYGDALLEGHEDDDLFFGVRAQNLVRRRFIEQIMYRAKWEIFS